MWKLWEGYQLIDSSYNLWVRLKLFLSGLSDHLKWRLLQCPIEVPQVQNGLTGWIAKLPGLALCYRGFNVPHSSDEFS